MPCAKADARPMEYPSARGGGVNPIAAILRQRPSSPNSGDELGLEVKESGTIVARQQQEGGRRKQKTRNSTDNNGAAKRGQTADEDKNKQRLIAWPRQVSYLACWSNRNQICLSRLTQVIICSIVMRLMPHSCTSNVCAPPYLECVSHSFK